MVSAARSLVRSLPFVVASDRADEAFSLRSDRPKEGGHSAGKRERLLLRSVRLKVRKVSPFFSPLAVQSSDGLLR